MNFNTIESNKKLAQQIIGQSQDQYVRGICSNDHFIVHPIAHLINEMIERGIGMARHDDTARAKVIEKIPGFGEHVGSAVYLRAFAANKYAGNPRLVDIMKIFEISLGSNKFQSDLQNGVKALEDACSSGDWLDFDYAEEELRSALGIFQLSAELKPYSRPELMAE